MMPEIKVSRIWDAESVRNACIRNELYTCGNSEEYSNMLNLVENSSPTVETLYTVAKDIVEHSDGQTVSNVMFILENHAVMTLFDVEDETE